MIRLLLLSGFIFFLCVYAWKDWYKSLCGLILLMAVIEHPDMPKTIFEIQGLNPWNIGFLVVFLAWVASRKREGLTWDMPRGTSVLLLLYLGVVLVGFVRMFADRSYIGNIPDGYLISEYLVNSVKWVLPGILMYDGYRDRSRLTFGLYCTVGLYFLIALQVAKWIPPGVAISGQELTARSLKILVREVGYHRVNLAMMLAGASWAMLAIRPLAVTASRRSLIILASIILTYALGLTAGRAGYATWACLGLTLCLVKWKKGLLLVPIVALVIAIAIPGVVERTKQGFTPETRDVNVRLAPADDYDESEPDLYTILAGRNIAWQYVVPKIGEAPVFGHGRLAMRRTGIATFLQTEFGEIFPHPHNAYLELLLDNGMVGFLIVISFYLSVLKTSFSLFLDRRNPYYEAVGGVAAALVLALLFASIGSQTFYPREGAVGMWCAMGLMLRLGVERSRATVEGKESFFPFESIRNPNGRIVA